MKFEWSTEKSILNYWKHRIRFEEVVGLLLLPVASWDVSREEDGEVRTKVVGYHKGILLTVIYTKRFESIRIISDRRSSWEERARYEWFARDQEDKD